MVEIVWKEIPGHPGYFASNLGQILGVSGKILKPWLNREGGYYKLRLGAGRQYYVHQLVMLAFVGPCPKGYEVDHRDFDKGNNARTNLRYRLKVVNNNRWRKHEDREDDRYDNVDLGELPDAEADIEPPI